MEESMSLYSISLSRGLATMCPGEGQEMMTAWNKEPGGSLAAGAIAITSSDRLLKWLEMLLGLPWPDMWLGRSWLDSSWLDKDMLAEMVDL